jgi:CRISPR/Cas system-associated protein Csm6
MLEEISDELLQAWLEKFKAGEPQRKCAKGNRVVRLCINPKCKEALMCNEPECAKCEAHEVCPTILLSGLGKMINERVGIFHDFAAQMLQIEAALVARIQQNRRKLMFEL